MWEGEYRTTLYPVKDVPVKSYGLDQTLCSLLLIGVDWWLIKSPSCVEGRALTPARRFLSVHIKTRVKLAHTLSFSVNNYFA